MASKRMFDKALIDTDRFMDLPMSAKALYFLLGMESDDEGFVSYKKVLRIHGGNEDDIKVLTAKTFLIMFESGVVVITDWNKNNWLDSRRIKPTEYKKEKAFLALNNEKEYVLSNGLANAKREEYSIEENRVEESRIEETAETSSAKEISEIIDSFKEVNISYKKWFGNKTQRSALERLLKLQSKEMILKVTALLPKTNKMQFFPTITTPLQLEDKWSALSDALNKKKGELIEKGNKNKIYGL